MNSRRIAAIYLPQLPCELAAPAKRPDSKVPLSQVSFGVVLVEASAGLDSTQRLMAVSEPARRLGIFEGQTLEEARAVNAAFVVRELPHSRLQLGLERVIDSLRDFDLTIAREEPNTIWIDITGTAHLLGGEAAIARELVERAQLLGHRTRVAISSGPRLAQIFARAASFSGPSTFVVSPERTSAELTNLPIVVLPLDGEAITWLTRLGVLTLGDLRQLPRPALLERLGASAQRWIDLANGIDPEPLKAHPPAPRMTESFEWEEPTSALEALQFALRRLTVRLEARLSGRGLAAEHVRVLIKHDKGIARHRGVAPVTEIDLKLATPIWHEDELRKIITTRLERTHLGAPSVGIELSVLNFAEAVGKQLELSRLVAGFGSHAKAELGLPVLLSELAAEVGPANLGVLSLADSFLPEKQGRLLGLAPTETHSVAATTKPASRQRRGSTQRRATPPTLQASVSETSTSAPRLRKARGHARIPTRLLTRPVPIEVPLKAGATLVLDREMYTVERVRFDHRLKNVEWWGDRPVSRDYLWLSLTGPLGKLEAFAYVDRDTEKVFLQGIRD